MVIVPDGDVLNFPLVLLNIGLYMLEEPRLEPPPNLIQLCAYIKRAKVCVGTHSFTHSFTRSKIYSSSLTHILAHLAWFSGGTHIPGHDNAGVK